MMIWETEFAKLVKSEFQKKKLKNSRYSIRQFAKKLGLSIGALSELLSGKRRLKKQRAFQILDLLEIHELEKKRIMALIGDSDSVSESSLPLFEAPQEIQAITKDWRNFILLAILHHNEMEEIIPAVANVTGLNASEVKSRLEHFKEKFPTESHLINFHVDPFQAHSQIFNGESLRSYRQGQVELLKKVTDTSSNANPFFYNLALFGSQEKYNHIIREIQEIILKNLSGEAPQEREILFQVSFQMLPFLSTSLNSEKSVDPN